MAELVPAAVMVACIVCPALWLAHRERRRPSWSESRAALGRAVERGQG